MRIPALSGTCPNDSEEYGFIRYVSHKKCIQYQLQKMRLEKIAQTTNKKQLWKN